MSNRLAVVIASALVATILILAVIGGNILRGGSHDENAPPLGDAVIIEATSDTLPQLPSTPDTTLPVVTTTTTTTTAPRRATTTTSTVPEPEVSGTTVEVTNATGVSLDDPDMAKWREIALCEMPGPGGVPSEPWGAHWSFKGSKFSGALGIATQSTWRAFGGLEFGPTAGHATWQEQIIVARRIRDRYGYSAWGCG